MMSSAPTTHLTGGSTLLQPLDAPQPKLEGEALMDALRQQLDFYFSRNNLLSDSFLLSHMNANRSVPLEIVANFRKIRALTEDRQSIIKALQRCQNCAADKDGVSVKVTWKVERTTLILRDLPTTISGEELKKSIFERDGSPAAGRIKEVRLEVGDNWFVTFDSESTTLATADWLMSQTYNGKPIPARVKSENLLRGFYYPTPKTYTDPALYTGVSPKAGAALNVNVTVPLGNSNVNSVNVHASVTSNMPMNGAYAGYPATMYAGPYGNAYYPYPYPYGAYNQYANGKNGQNQQRRPNQGGKKGKKGQEDGSVDVASPSLQSNTNESIEGEGKKKKKGGNNNQQPQQQGLRRKSNQNADPLFAAPMMGFDAAFAAPFYPPAIPLIQPNPPNRANLGYKKQYKHYSREQLAAIVDAVSSTNYSKPDGLSKVDDAEGIIVRQEPLKKTTITEPMPVIYPASPSPQLAAQPHHSSEMPFLDLMAGAHYLPFDPNFNQQQPQKKNTQKKQNAQKPKNTTNSSATTNATNAPAPTSTQSDQQQPSAGKKKGKKNDENHSAGSDEQKSKPPTAAAIVAASAHKQPAIKPVNKPQPSPAKPATATTNNTTKETAHAASTTATSPSSTTPAVSAPAATPSTAPVGARPLVNYAARVGSLPPEEVAKRAKAVEDAKREKAKIEEEKKKKQLEEERKARGEPEEEKKEEKPAKSERKEKKKREKRERYEKREQKEEEKVADKAEEQKPAAPKPFSFADMVRKAATPNTTAPKAPSTEPKVAAPTTTTAAESKATTAAVVARNPSH